LCFTVEVSPSLQINRARKVKQQNTRAMYQSLQANDVEILDDKQAKSINTVEPNKINAMEIPYSECGFKLLL